MKQPFFNRIQHKLKKLQRDNIIIHLFLLNNRIEDLRVK